MHLFNNWQESYYNEVYFLRDHEREKENHLPKSDLDGSIIGHLNRPEIDYTILKSDYDGVYDRPKKKKKIDLK